ncbi:hypothetical protein ACWGK1_00545 [Streptomyces wedmorensis]
MARTSDPLPQNNEPAVVLARFLRTTQDASSTVAAPMTLKRISTLSGVSEASLSKAQNGDPRTSWRTVEAWVRVCGGDMTTARRLWNQVHVTQKEAVPEWQASLVSRAYASWSRYGVPVVVSGLKSEEEFLTALGAVLTFKGVSLRVLADIARQSGIPFSRASLGAVLSGKRPMTFEHLAAILFGCGVPVRQQQGWARVFAKLDPSRDLATGWKPRHLRKGRPIPAPEEAVSTAPVSSPARLRFAQVLERALMEENVTIKVFAARTKLDIEVLDRLFAGLFVPAWTVEKAREAAVGARPATQQELRRLSRMLVRSPSPEERREWNRFMRDREGVMSWAG